MGNPLKEIDGKEAAYLIPMGLTASFDANSQTIQVNMAGGKKLIIRADLHSGLQGVFPELKFFSLTP